MPVGSIYHRTRIKYDNFKINGIEVYNDKLEMTGFYEIERIDMTKDKDSLFSLTVHGLLDENTVI
jgi:hypothetical protein